MKTRKSYAHLTQFFRGFCAFLRLSRLHLKILALLGLGYYLFHNLLHLLQGHLAPSLLTTWTGLPCPTTGGTRSLLAYADGQWLEGFYWNPFSLPLLALALLSLGYLLRLRTPHHLPPWLGSSWLVTLTLAWLTKFILGSQWW
jgi:Protein of unknown function (DUF2752)